MININNTIQNAIYGYNPDEFFPIYSGAELINKNAFLAYKAKRVLGFTVRIAHYAVYIFAAAIFTIMAGGRIPR